MIRNKTLVNDTVVMLTLDFWAFYANRYTVRCSVQLCHWLHCPVVEYRICTAEVVVRYPSSSNCKQPRTKLLTYYELRPTQPAILSGMENE